MTTGENKSLPNSPSSTQEGLSRRGFMRLAALMGAGAILGACGSDDEAERERRAELKKYPEHTVVASIFGIGEKPSQDNDHISNEVLAWDKWPVLRFGGVDDLKNRDEQGLPTEFTPIFNPYYFALPANEFDGKNLIPGARLQSPWRDERVGPNESLFKGRWIKVKKGDRTIYAQWVDTGPNEEQDYNYVFGSSSDEPKNTFGVKAGLDLSPTAAHNLGFSIDEGQATVTWRFIDAVKVPDGPWRSYSPIDNAIHWDKPSL